VTETEYFDLLEGRVSSELSGMRQRELRGWWCDGFIVEKFVVTRSGSHVAGRVWLDPGNGDQALWNFVLLGPRPMNRDEVQWAELLPAADATGWLFLDFERKFMKIKLSAAYPDPPAQHVRAKRQVEWSAPTWRLTSRA
jgi:hypothetical protein